MRRLALPALLLAGMAFPALCGAQATRPAPADEEAVGVYRNVQMSVVGLKNAECSGTGILLDATGLILTNAHVAVSPLPFQCGADVLDGGKPRQVTFKKVQVIGFHPHLDLALLKIDLAEAGRGVALKSVRVSRDKGNPGQRIYAIGNPAANGMILNKTITSGMLSGVDREVDGDRFYQIDAAINPGNSGGPICDRNGQVLGLVTFKFTDAQAISFAIPLQDLDPRAFVPLLQRRANPEKAAELTKIAADLHAKALKIVAAEGKNSDKWKLYNTYAAMCYRVALVYDSSDPEIYGNIGNLMTFLEENEIAIAYLVRFFRMHPWEGNGHLYAQLGFSLGRLNRQAEQAVVWQEGLAKFPWNGKLWEDMAFNYRYFKHHEEAASAAAFGMFCGLPRDRFEVVKKILAEEKAALPADGQQKLQPRLSNPAVLASLDHLTEVSNAARRERKLYMTQAFADFIAASDGPPFPGGRESIPVAPMTRPDRFKNLKYDNPVSRPAAP